jgi:quercetin dioxygenase-like cupin family protein
MNRQAQHATLILLALCGAPAARLAQAEAPASNPEPIQLDAAKLVWEASSAPGFPEGALRKVLHRNPQNGAAALLRRHPKGYIEPRHVHSTANHGVYILSGSVRTAGIVSGPGSFFYAPAGYPHGPIEALEDVEFLLWTDGPLDLQLLVEVDPAEPAKQAESKH